MERGEHLKRMFYRESIVKLSNTTQFKPCL